MTSDEPTIRDLAAAALDLAYTDPKRARAMGMAAIAAADGDMLTRSVAQQAIGLTLAAVGELSTARKHLVASVRTALDAGLDASAAEARGSLAYVLTLLGEPGAALRELDRALPVAGGVPGARLRMQRALVLYESGRFEESAGAYERAMAALAEAGGDPLVEASIRNNRSILRVRMGDWRGAEEDLRLAEELYTATGHIGRIAMVFHNRGIAATVRGDIPAALAAYDDAAARYVATGRDPGLLPVEHADTLLSVGLVPEARGMAAAAVAAFTAAGNAIDVVQARVVLAQAALAAGDFESALAEAERAKRAAARQRRYGWAALARYLALRARWQLGHCTNATLRSGCAAVDALAGAGWVVATADARVIVARMALELGRTDLARRELAKAGRARHTGPTQVRIRAWHATALLRLSGGDRRGAVAALRAGLRVLDQFRAGLGAAELRVHTSGHGQDLAALGLRLAVESGRADSVLWWAEQWRAGALRQRSARPPNDAALAAALAELRQVTADVTTTITTGGDARALVRRQSAVEDRVRRISRHAANSAADTEAATGARLGGALGTAVLVEYLVVHDQLHAVVVRDGRTRLHPLGPVSTVWRDVDVLRFSLRGIAYGLGGSRSLEAAQARVAMVGRRLDDVLLGPLAIDGRDLVIVPTGHLHGLAWSALPTCAERAVSVAPSAGLWLRAASHVSVADGPPVFAAGPDLVHANAEIAALTRNRRTARRFTGRRAKVEDVASAMDGATLAHIAAHGHLRVDNPQFSALRMADGPLTVYDLERLGTAPDLVVLSACDSGLSAVRPGDEVAGLAAALLAMGARVLIAPVLPVPDHATRPVMVRVHRYLRAGFRPADALARTRADFAAASPAHRTAVAGFQCFGAG